jgi:hypothetical protein
MGAWGPGLYSNDFGLDLRSTIRAISRLPFESDRLLDVAIGTARAEATVAENPDYATFWLVVADQFQKRGIENSRALETALAIIDSGGDATIMRELGMSESDIRKRIAKMQELRQRLSWSPPSPRGRVLSNPRAFLMEPGDIFAFATHAGVGINPYCRDYRGHFDWRPDAWSAFLVAGRGRAFGYLPWYLIVTLRDEVQDRPSLEAVRDKAWALHGTGTCSTLHMKRLELQSLGSVSLDHDRLVEAYGALPEGTQSAVDDISISNCLWSLSDTQGRFGSGIRSHIERLPSAKLSELLD